MVSAKKICSCNEVEYLEEVAPKAIEGERFNNSRNLNEPVSPPPKYGSNRGGCLLYHSQNH